MSFSNFSYLLCLILPHRWRTESYYRPFPPTELVAACLTCTRCGAHRQEYTTLTRLELEGAARL